jgi:hypothetical protein
MSHFAKVENGIVTQVIVADQEVINSGLFGNPLDWVETCYDTHNGVHANGGTPLRGNYAKIGSVYDPELDAFYDPNHRGSSWTLNTTTFQWEPPTPYPDDGKFYFWNPQTDSWSEII